MSIAKVYTLTADFDEGTYANTNATDVAHQVQLSALTATRPFNFVHVPGSFTNTLLRINATSGTVVGEYKTRPDPAVSPGPSRVAIDRYGNCYVANRATTGGVGTLGSIAKIGIVIGGTRCDVDGTPNAAGLYVKDWSYTTCVDRDGDGLLNTSGSLGDVRAWTTDTGLGTTGSVLGAADD